MIIDADCHISSYKFDARVITAPELIDCMGRANVDKALVWLAPPYDRNIAPENVAVHAAVDQYPDRLLGIGWANPRLGRDVTADTIRRCFEEYGFRGIKFNGAQDDYVIDDPQLSLPLIELAAEYGKPIAFHIGADSYENTHPYRLGHIAARFPETPILMVHMGGASKPPLDRAAIETSAQHSNITIIGSAIPAGSILRAIETLGPDRVCFGSDTPFNLMHVELAKYRALLRDFDAPAQAAIMGGNLARMLDL